MPAAVRHKCKPVERSRFAKQMNKRNRIKNIRKQLSTEIIGVNSAGYSNAGKDRGLVILATMVD
jgi:hypothetical protein